MVSSGTLIMSIQAVLMSTGVLAMALLLKISVPLAMDFSVSRAPIIWSSLLSWLKPPYLYVVINGIIVTIMASSRFDRTNREEEDDVYINRAGKIPTEQIFHRDPPPKPAAISVDPVPDSSYETVKNFLSGVDFAGSAAEIVYEAEEKREEAEEEEKSVMVESTGLVEDSGDESVTSPLAGMDSSVIPSEYLYPAEKPLVSARFNHRKAVKATPEGGRTLTVAKPKQHETLENTWKMITEGRSMPLTRHSKKSDTWENHGRLLNVDTSAFQKSETFRDRTNYQPSPEMTPSTVKLRKEPSLSQDELNRRAEAFIKKVNEEMKLQRLESLKQYK